MIALVPITPRLCAFFFPQVTLKVALCITFVRAKKDIGEEKMSLEKCKVTP